MRKVSNRERMLKSYRYRFGGNNPKWLHEYFYHLQYCEDIGLLVDEPLDIRNTIVKHCKWMSDQEVHGVPEHWPQDAAGVRRILKDRVDDCDGFAVTTASILYTKRSVPEDEIWITVGWLENSETGAQLAPTDINHAWVMVGKPSEFMNDIKLLETAGDQTVEVLPTLFEMPEYTPVVMANPLGEYWSV